MKNDSDQPKGFAGLADMTSKVDVPEVVNRSTQLIQPLSTSPETTATSPERRPFELDEGVLASLAPKGMSSQKKWMIGVGIVVAIVVMAGLIDNKSSSGYSAPTLYEEVPPQGSGQVLSDNQIRYCLSQDIRISAWGTAVDHFSQTAIDSFNSAVGDYNIRCANYKYRRGSLERVRSEVEARRAVLQSEGTSKSTIYR